MQKIDLSIHPRNWPSSGNGKVKNTCAPQRQGRVFNKVQDRFIRRLNDWDITQNALPIIQRAGYRKPGSRNPSKLRQR